MIEIGGISFISCGGVELLNVGTLTIDRSNFISQHFSWSVDNVRNATITTTSFIHGQIGPILVVIHSSLLIKSSTFINTAIIDNNKRIGDPCEGTAIYCTESFLNVVQSNFSQNGVGCTFSGYGGAIYAISTDVNITGSIFSDNLSLH